MAAPLIAPVFARLRQVALLAAILGILLSLVGLLFQREHFFRSWLFGFVFWSNLALGSLGLLMVSHLVRGSWGALIRRQLEAFAATLPLLLVLFLPLLFGLEVLYPWTREAARSDPVLLHKAPYLNVPFFLGRAALFFGAWCALAHFLDRWSKNSGESGMDSGRRLRRLSGPGLGIYVLTATFAATDWVMSQDPKWASTVYGLLFIVGQGLGALALAIAVTAWLKDRGPLSEYVTPSHLHDLGNLLLAFVLLWAYISFSQYLIIWYGNLPEEITWVLARTKEGWQAVALGLIVLHFAVPFFLLLSQRVKRRHEWLGGVAVAILLMRLVENYWLVMPAHDGEQGGGVHWLDLAAPIGIGGAWLAFAAWKLGRHPLITAGASVAGEGGGHA